MDGGKWKVFDVSGCYSWDSEPGRSPRTPTVCDPTHVDIRLCVFRSFGVGVEWKLEPGSTRTGVGGSLATGTGVWFGTGVKVGSGRRPVSHSDVFELRECSGTPVPISSPQSPPPPTNISPPTSCTWGVTLRGVTVSPLGSGQTMRYHTCGVVCSSTCPQKR